MNVSKVEEEIGYRFNDNNLLLAALTHPSYLSTHHAESYQRLEFLGDAFLDYVIARFLYKKYPYKNEGFLTKTRSKIVSRVAIAKAFRPYNLSTEMRIGDGVDLDALIEFDGSLCDLFESLVGAMVIDGGLAAAESFILKVLAEAIDAVEHGSAEIDYKSRLIEISNKEGKKVRFVIVAQMGEAHDPTFVMGVEIDGVLKATAEGRSKRQAEQRASKELVLKKK